MLNTIKQILLFLWVFLLFPAISPASDSQPPPEGGMLPDIVLAVPEDPGHRQYLGLSQTGQFKIPDIKAEVVIVEIFSMY
jgi:hypothetical protein